MHEPQKNIYLGNGRKRRRRERGRDVEMRTATN